MIAFLGFSKQSNPEIQKIPPRGPIYQNVAAPSKAKSKKLKKPYQEILDEHNRVRAAVGVGPLIWSDTLASYAQEWADHLARVGCRMQHRPPSGGGNHRYGENMFAGTAGYYGMIDAVQSWESEKQHYSGGPIIPSNFRKIGHYTQMVWRDTTHVGCGAVTCRGQLIIVCNYDPPGNIVGKKPY
jgi:pathogenesis-related protein 1